MKPAQIRVDMPPELRRQLKYRAFDEGKSLSQLVREMIEAAMNPNGSEASEVSIDQAAFVRA